MLRVCHFVAFCAKFYHTVRTYTIHITFITRIPIAVIFSSPYEVALEFYYTTFTEPNGLIVK